MSEGSAGASGETGSRRFVRDGVTRPAEHGVAWLKAGWDLFARAPVTWIGVIAALLVINIAANFVPVAGSLAMALLFPVFSGGLMLGCRSLAQGGRLDLSYLFAGFRGWAPRLVVVGAVSLLGTVAALVLMYLVMGGAAFTAVVGSAAPPVVPPSKALLGLLVGLGVMVPVYMTIWFAPVLIVLEDAPAGGALRASFSACRKNFLGFLVYGVVLLVLAVLATLPLGLGWLVLGPIAVGSVYSAYRDVYYEARGRDLPAPAHD